MPEKPTQHDEFLAAYDAHADAIFRHCYFRVFDREKAREMMQDVFTKTWEYVSSGKEVENLRAFLYRVANNMIIDWSRKKKESSLDDMMDAGFDPASHGERTSFAAEAGEAMALLERIDAKYRDAVRMRFLDELTPKEIALATGESENVISVRIHRGIKQLQALLARPPEPARAYAAVEQEQPPTYGND